MAAVESAVVYLSYRLLLPTGIKDYRLKAGVHSKKLNQWIEQVVDTKEERMWQSIEGWSKHQDSLAGRNCLDGCLKLLPNLSRNTSLSKLSGQCGCVRRFYVWSFYTLVCFSSQLMRFLVFSRKKLFVMLSFGNGSRLLLAHLLAHEKKKQNLNNPCRSRLFQLGDRKLHTRWAMRSNFGWNFIHLSLFATSTTFLDSSYLMWNRFLKTVKRLKNTNFEENMVDNEKRTEEKC